jgi:hypothetical protein
MANTDVTKIPAYLPCTAQADDQVFVTDIDGDGINELVVYSRNLQQISIVHAFAYSQFTFTYPDASAPTVLWPNATDQNWMTSWSSSQGVIEAADSSVVAWAISQADNAICLDVNGDGQPEIVVFNTLTGGVGVLRWQNGATQTIWSAASIGNGGASWSVSRGDSVYPGRLTNSAPNQVDLLVVNPANPSWVGILQWDEGQLKCIWVSGNNWIEQFELYSDDSYLVADVNQDGRDEVVIQSRGNSFLGVFEWGGAQLNFLSQAGGQVPGLNVTSWELHDSDQMQVGYYYANSSASPNAITPVIVVLNADTGYMGVLQWGTQECLNCVWLSDQIGGPSSPWQVNSQNQYFVLPPPAGEQNLIPILVYNSGSKCVAVLTWSPLSSSPELPCLAGPAYQYSTGWSVSSGSQFFIDTSSSTATPKVFVRDVSLGAISSWNDATSNQPLIVTGQTSFPVPTWSPTMLASAPSTPFPVYSGDQLDIYQYLSQQIPLMPQVSDIRQLYTNASYQNSFALWAEVVKETAMPTGKDWTTTDWQTVQDELCVELADVSYVFGWYTALYETFWSYVIAQQQADLSTVRVMIQPASNPITHGSLTIAYWTGQVFVGLIWGLAAVPGLDLLAMPLAMSASLAGSAYAAPTSAPPTINDDQLKQDIDNTNASNLLDYQAEVAVIVGDPLKMVIFSALLEHQWALTVGSLSDQQAPISAANRTCFYQVLLPGVFTITLFPNSQSQVPEYKTGEPTVPPSSAPICPLDDTWSYYWEPNAANPQNWDIYLLSQGTGFPNVGLPTQALMSDLFTELNISRDIFFRGYSGWGAIPQDTYG